eukprot:4691900-Prymnesium_polylepis.1
MHCDFRGTEMISEEAERDIRETLEGNAAHQPVVDEYFNKVMSEHPDLKVRHSCVRDEKGKVPHRGFNGHTAKRVR